jgi:lysyl-tRNA synthetase class 2
LPRPGEDWRPGADAERLRLRAGLLRAIRGFFDERGVLEVETPVLCASTVTDLHLHSLETRFTGPGAGAGRRLYLQTSPESAMKRLLAAGAGPIYQLARVFRDGEAGRLHNPEFTLLEWYRPGWDYRGLMAEVEALVAGLLGLPRPFERLSYAEVFERHLGLDPHRSPVGELRARGLERGLGDPPAEAALDRDGWLDLLLSHLIQPRLGLERPAFVCDYPASQAALARVRPGDPPVAERFELFVRGIELANGYGELVEAAEQRRRFECDRTARRAAGLPDIQPDERLLAALGHGLPPCAGVALGFDRLAMLAAGVDSIMEIMAFSLDRA